MVAIDQPQTETDGSRPMIDVINPATQARIGQIPITSRAEVAATVERARFAQQAWGALAVTERTRFIRRWLDAMWEHQSDAIRRLREENGKSDASAYLEFVTVDTIAQYYIHHAPRLLRTQSRSALFPLVQRVQLHRKPRGVVGVISPWNYPFALPFMDAIPALIAGNSVVLKPSEITPFIAQFAVEMMHEVGIPQDVMQIVHGDGTTGAALVDHVDYVQFTGSNAVGRKIGTRCVERLIPFSLELGGNDPSIVLADADPEATAVGLIQGAFENNGQMCISIERVYVEAAIYDNLLAELLQRVPQLRLNSGGGMDVTIGSMTNRAELERTQAHIQDALDKGATLLAGGKPRPDLGELFFEPTILTDVDHSMAIMTEETFGPVLPIMRVRDSQEAVQLANQNIYGLSASIFSRDLRRAEEIATQIDSGDVSINRAQFVIATPSLPFGGQRESGLGRRNGDVGLLKYTASQSILTDKMWITDQDLTIATPRTMFAVNALRHLRRYIPFI